MMNLPMPPPGLPGDPAGVPPMPRSPAIAADIEKTRPPGDEGPERRSALPVVLALVLTALVGVGAFALVSWARGGAACETGAFESVRFGYCAEPPGGWLAAAAEGEDTSLDRFLLQDGAATITVTAVPLTRGQDLARFEQFVRGFDEEAGATTGSSSQREVDGADAVAFDVTLDGPDGVTRSREVLFARDGIAWRVTLADDQVGFEASARRLDEMLETWRFV
ncbi:hypothetical protein BH18ACT17_BH18ACT17_16110 [soil metagenome]